MIRGFEEAELMALFLDGPAYIGTPEAGEMLFQRKYDNGLSAILFLDIHGGRMEVSICWGDHACVASYAADVDRIAAYSSAVLFWRGGSMIAELRMEPYPHLNLIQKNMPDYSG